MLQALLHVGTLTASGTAPPSLLWRSDWSLDEGAGDMLHTLHSELASLASEMEQVGLGVRGSLGLRCMTEQVEYGK